LEKQSNFNFITLLNPYANYSRCINEEDKNPSLSGWKQKNISFKATGTELNSISKEERSYLFNVKSITIGKITIDFAIETDIYLEQSKDSISLFGLGVTDVSIVIKEKTTIEENGAMIKPLVF
jgi:hypothetical protein